MHHAWLGCILCPQTPAHTLLCANREHADPIKAISNTHMRIPFKHLHFPSAFLQKIVFELEGSSGYKPSNAPTSSQGLCAGRIACRRLISLWMGSKTLNRLCFQENCRGPVVKKPPWGLPRTWRTLLAEQQLKHLVERLRAVWKGWRQKALVLGFLNIPCAWEIEDRSQQVCSTFPRPGNPRASRILYSHDPGFNRFPLEQERNHHLDLGCLLLLS